MADDIESRVLRYKSRLQNCTDEEKLQETLLKIADIPITVDILQRTKIGKVVNGLRKREGDLGFLARSIVSEWKSMVARMQSREEEEEEEEAPSITDKPSSSPEIETNERSPTPDDQEEVSNDMGSSHNKKSSREEDKLHRHSSSHSSSHSSKDKINRHSSSKEHRFKNQEKSTEGRKENRGDSKKSSSSDKKQSQSESSSKSKAEQSESKSDRREDTHNSHKSHSKTKDSKSNSESSDRKESKHHESKHSGNRHSSKHSSKDSSKSSDKDASKDTENKHDKHGHSSHDSRKSESRHSSSDKKDKHYSRHRDQESDHSKRHYNQSSSGSTSKKSSHSTENCDTGKQDKEHSSSRSDNKDFMRSKRPKHTLSESDSENSQEEKEEEGSSPSKMLGHWDGLSSDGEKSEEPGGFFFNDEYVDHEALLDEALNKYHMEPLLPKPGYDSADRKSVKRSSEDVKGDGHSDGSKRRKIESEAKKSSLDSGKKREDSKHRSHSSHKSKSSSSSKSSSQKNDKEGKKDRHDKEGKSRSKEPSSFEDSIAAVPVKKPKADPNYEKLKSKFKIKKKGEVSEKTKSEQKSKVDVSEGVKVPAPPPKLRLSQRELASLVRNNTVPNYRPIEETMSAASQFDDSMIGQKSYAKTMVYSGKRNTVVPKVIPLQEICLNVLANHIDSVEAVGSAVPYYLFEPVLKRCTAAQLYRIEDFNPHFLEETDQLWKIHCEREFKGSEPDEFETYRELYLRKYDEKERKLKQIKTNISQSMAKAVPERTAKLAYIDSYVKPPREVRRQQLKYGTAGPSTGERSKKFSHLMDPIALGRKEREEKAVKQKAPMMQKTMMMLKKMRR